MNLNRVFLWVRMLFYNTCFISDLMDKDDHVAENMSFNDLQFSDFYYPGLKSLFGLSPIIQNKNLLSKNDNAKIITAKNVLNRLLCSVEKRGLSKYYAYETMRRLVARNQYLYSYKHQIIELIQVLTEVNDHRLKIHINYFCQEVNYVKII